MDINTILINTLTGIGVALIGLAGSYFTYYIKKASDNVKAQTKTIQDKATRDLLDKTLDNLTNLVNVNVTSASETIVKELKASTIDGTLTKEDASNVLQIVKGKVLTQLSDSGKETLSTTISDLDGYIESSIETALKQIKAQTIPFTSSDKPVEVAPVKLL